MAETQNKPEETNQDQSSAVNMPINIHAQYIKDLSYENPGAPESFVTGQKSPRISINFGLDATPVENPDNVPLYESIIKVEVMTNANDDMLLFVMELEYATLVEIGKDVPEDAHHPILLIEVPKLAFPYVREVVSNITLKGGYPPVMLEPIDFQAMYIDRFEEEIKARQAQAMAESEETETVN